MSYRHTPEMGEISGWGIQGGVGGGYEKTCQDMLEAGVQWIVEHPEFEFKASGFQNVVGIIYPDNEDTQALIKVVVDASREGPDSPPEATGAQVHTVMRRLGFIAEYGWNKYVEEMIKAERERTQ